jgi:hypothetical protein
MNPERSRRDSLLGFARTLTGGERAQVIVDPMEALSVILDSMGGHALAGTEHVPDPAHSTVEKCSVTACFLAACSVPLISWLKEEGHEVDPVPLMHLVGARIFRSFGEEDRKAIVDSGVMLFREMAHMAREYRRMEEWMASVHNVAERFVLTEGTSDCVELIAPLYLVLLMATKQTKP